MIKWFKKKRKENIEHTPIDHMKWYVETNFKFTQTLKDTSSITVHLPKVRYIIDTINSSPYFEYTIDVEVRSKFYYFDTLRVMFRVPRHKFNKLITTINEYIDENGFTNKYK
jgi:hypothetical protein